MSVSNDTPKASERSATVAYRAFDAFVRGIETGNYQDFVDLLHEDGKFRIFSVLDEYRGRTLTKEEAAAFHRREGDDWNFRAVVTRGLVLRSGDSFAFEFSHEGHAVVGPYSNQLVLVLDVNGNKVVGYREYAAGIDPAVIDKLKSH